MEGPLALLYMDQQRENPVLYFHGTPSSRLEPLLLGPYGIDLPKLLHRYNIKLIAIDRPGNGLSTIHTNGTFLSFANDAMHVLMHLNISSAVLWAGPGPDRSRWH
jgi:pimeloyl-ACP methyl ester carboxylesterase